MAIYSKFVMPGLLILAASTLGDAAVVPLPITILPISELVPSPSSLAVPSSVKFSASEATITGSTHTKERREEESSGCAQYGLASLVCDVFDIEKRTAKAEATASGRAEQIDLRVEELILIHPDKISPAERITARQEEEDEDDGVTEEVGEAVEEISGELAEDGAEVLEDVFDKRDDDDEDILQKIGEKEQEIIAEVVKEASEVFNDIFDRRGTHTRRQTDLEDEIVEEISEEEDELVGEVEEVKDDIKEEVEEVVDDILDK